MAYDNITSIDKLEHDTSQGRYSSIVRIDDTHIIVAYSGPGDDGYIKTFSIDSDGDNITQIDSLEHESVSRAWDNSLCKIDDTHFALAYHDSVNGYLKTFSIDGSYDTITEIDKLTHTTSAGFDNSLILLDSTHLALAYEQGTVVDGKVKTFSFDGSFDNITEIDSYTFDTVHGFDNSIVKIDDTHLILATAGESFDGYIYTFSVNGSYVITEIDSIEHDSAIGKQNSLMMLNSTNFMLAYSGSGDDGYIKTFSIDSSYDNITEIDSLEHDTVKYSYTQPKSLVRIDDTHAILAYSSGAGYIGTVKTFSVDGSYDNIAVIESLTYTTGYGYYCTIDEMKDGLYAFAYSGEGASNDGFLSTFSIDLPTLTTRRRIMFAT